MTGQQRKAQTGCLLARTYAKRRVRKDSGFFVASIRKAGIFAYVVDEYVQQRYVKH